MKIHSRRFYRKQGELRRQRKEKRREERRLKEATRIYYTGKAREDRMMIYG